MQLFHILSYIHLNSLIYATSLKNEITLYWLRPSYKTPLNLVLEATFYFSHPAHILCLTFSSISSTLLIIELILIGVTSHCTFTQL